MRFLLLSLPLPARAAAPFDAESIMAGVAKNQERAESARNAYVYHQDVLVRLLKTNGKLAREERRAYVVTPTATGTHHDLIETKSAPSTAGEIDRDLAGDLASDLTRDSRSRDGIDHDLFPLTSAKQKQYSFRLVGRESYRERRVYHIYFEPRTDQVEWKGDAYIDEDDLQPVMISTRMAHSIPLVVRTVLGTNIANLGFKITYRPFDGQWFPESYSGEMKLRVLFLYSRRAGIRLENRNFQRTEVSTELSFPVP